MWKISRNNGWITGDFHFIYFDIFNDTNQEWAGIQVCILGIGFGIVYDYADYEDYKWEI